MGYELLEKPISDNEIKDGQVNCVIAVGLNTVMNTEFEDLMDVFESKITKNGILQDIQFEMVGCNPLMDEIHFHVDAAVIFA